MNPPSPTKNNHATPPTVSNKEECQIQLTRCNNIFILTLTGKPHPANVFTMSLLRRLDQLLDQVESHLIVSSNPEVSTAKALDNHNNATPVAIPATTTPAALILNGNGKFFSAGFDLQALTGQSHSSPNNNNTNTNKKKNKTTRHSHAMGNGHPSRPTNSNTLQQQQQQQQELVEYSWKILARLLVFPLPTIAFVNGHAFGLGLFLALACDHRVMEQQQQISNHDDHYNKNQKKVVLPKLCLPEITIGLPLGSGFAAFAKCKLRSDTLRTAALTGKQYQYDEALQAGIIDAIIVAVPPSSTNIITNATTIPPPILSMAEKLVSTSEKGNLSAIKMELYGETYRALMTGKSRAKL